MTDAIKCTTQQLQGSCLLTKARGDGSPHVTWKLSRSAGA